MKLPRCKVRTRLVALVTAVSLLVSGMAASAHAQPEVNPEVDIPAHRPAAAVPPAIPKAKRTRMLGENWEKSDDRAWVAIGDANGFHLLVADAAEGFHWRKIATLAEPGFDTDRWIGNACVTGSGRRAVVAYAPRTFTNEPDLAQRGAFTAIIDFTDGTVTKLPVQTSLAYFNPSCGAGEEALLTQEGTEDLQKTRLVLLDTVKRKLGSRIDVSGQLTSAVPSKGGIIAADAGGLVRVADDGTRRVFAATRGVPFKVAADKDGGVVFMEHKGGEQVQVRRATTARIRGSSRAAEVTTLATGLRTDVDVTSGAGGRVFVTGTKTQVAKALPQSVRLDSVPTGSRMSMRGTLAVSSVREAETDPRSVRLDSSVTAVITAKAMATGQNITFAVSTAEAMYGEQGPTAGRALSPAITANGQPTVAGDPHNPADPDNRTCSVIRADPRNQAMQPKPRQVEWAVDQAVRGVLDVPRPANWKNLGMPAYSPQGLFPAVALNGGGYVPAQVMLGVAAQESNMWQAARSVVPGVTGNPLIGNYFGIDYYNDTETDDWTIDWAEADCGYGVTQVTDGMRLAGKERPGETAMPYQTQRAVALDFAANVAAGLRILQTKWNETRSNGLVINNGDSSKIENWFYAVWAYNSGFHGPQGDGSPWGVGWLNNPVNPRYPANRLPFLDTTYEDAAHPQDWPYPEKIMGFAGHPVEILESPGNLVAGFRPAWWNGGDIDGPINRALVKPPADLFCDASNDCEPGATYLPNDPDVIGEPAGPCAHQNSAGQYDLKCWYHEPSTWKEDCDYSCGNELLRFDPGYDYQADGTAYPPRCTLDGLPSNALVIDDVPDGTPSVRPNCGRPWNNAGTFQFTFKPDGDTTYPGKVDIHQVGGGFGGHFWFTHTRTENDQGGLLEVQATWRLNQSRTGAMRILVALPDYGAHTHYAKYTVKTAQGNRIRVVHQPGDGNRWVSLGAFMFDGVPEVTLTSVTPDGTGEQDIAFDAMAFVPIEGTYHEETVEAVAVFDEDQNIDTAAPESWLGGNLAGRQALYDWAIATTDQILSLPRCDSPAGNCITLNVADAVQQWRDDVVTAGTDPVDHPDGMSIARWIGFANSYLDRPTSDQRPSSFDDDARYKIRNKATVSFLTDNNKIIRGSEWVSYKHRTGNTHLPDFVLELIRSVAADYDIPAPNLSYRIRDANVHDNGWTNANPMLDGVLPGRAYAVAGKAPVLTNYQGEQTSSDADCVRAWTVAGAAIGYRPMLGYTSGDGPNPVVEMGAFAGQVLENEQVPEPIADLVDEIRNMFFDAGVPPEGSVFDRAPPIWQELNFHVCADGTLRQVSGRPILRMSWMPDNYLYHNSKAIDQTGQQTGVSTPLVAGDFLTFSHSPHFNHNETPYNPCRSESGRSGNPWNISLFDETNVDPRYAFFCNEPAETGDPTHSSPLEG